MTGKRDNFAHLDDIIREINSWASRCESEDDESEESESRNETAQTLIQGIDEMRRLATDGVWCHKEELSFRSSLVHDAPLFGTHENLGENVNEHAEYYFSQNKFHSISLDWLYTNLLIAYSFQRHRDKSESATSDIVGGSFYRGTLEFIDGRFIWGSLMILGWILVRLVKAVLVLLPFAAVDSQYFYPTMIISSGTLATIIISRSRLDSMYLSLKRKTLEELESISRVYALAARKYIQWEVLDDELSSTRRRGVRWLTSLFIASRNRRGGSFNGWRGEV